MPGISSEKKYYPDSEAKFGNERMVFEELTPRQRQVVLHLSHGLVAKQIAANLGVSVKTVEFHKARIYAKLGCSGPVEVLRYAIRAGFIRP